MRAVAPGAYPVGGVDPSARMMLTERGRSPLALIPNVASALMGLVIAPPGGSLAWGVPPTVAKAMVSGCNLIG